VRTFLGLVILIVVILIVVVLLWRRRTKDEIHSIDRYKNALETLQEMRGDTGSTSVRVLDEQEARSLRQPHAPSMIRSSDRERLPASGHLRDGEDGFVFDDANPESHAIRDHEHVRGHDSSEWAISRMQSRPPFQNRQWLVVGVATAVILILFIIGTLIGSSSTSSNSATTTSSSAPKTSTTTTPKTTPTTSPSAYVPQAGATANAATYVAPSSRYVLVLTATGNCWTTAVTSPGNAQLFVGTISPGTPQRISVTGGAQVSLGAPGNIAITLNGLPVTFPSGFQTPLVLTFQPATPPTTTTTVTPSVTTTTVAPTTTSTTQKP